MHPTDAAAYSWTAPAGNPLEDLLAAKALVEAADGYQLDTYPPTIVFELSDEPHITARERDDLDRHTRAIAQAEAAGITGLRDVWTQRA